MPKVKKERVQHLYLYLTKPCKYCKIKSRGDFISSAFKDEFETILVARDNPLKIKTKENLK